MDTVNEHERGTAHRAVVLFYRAVAVQDIALLRTAVTPDWQYIPNSCVALPVRGADGMVPVFAALSSALSSMQVSIFDLILIHTNYVGVRARVSGTLSRNMRAVPAASREVDFMIHSVHEIRNGLIARTWHLEDWLDTFRESGELPGLPSQSTTIDQRSASPSNSSDL
ncbi:MAG TPA: ester cyclase [Paraburkholderia sp.]|uniref:ester cyclase n=1 Tax=Paraburkholderia sp. TaxID=1926495 RepID=UPI002B463120|nr:ester cyclase [Paraburkholderia sp.]HKR41488.1 ester cyclase [Paraburkholderia sp.]